MGTTAHPKDDVMEWHLDTTLPLKEKDASKDISISLTDQNRLSRLSFDNASGKHLTAPKAPILTTLSLVDFL
jgi:hypothetical protein